MDKEKIITIVLGLLVGIGLAAAYFFGSKFLPALNTLNKQPKTTTSNTKKNSPPPPTPVVQQMTNNTLAITQPDDNSSTTDKTVQLTGSYTPGSTIILFANADENIATSDAQGKFNFKVSLESGENEITVSSFDQNGKLMTVKRNVTMEITP